MPDAFQNLLTDPVGTLWSIQTSSIYLVGVVSIWVVLVLLSSSWALRAADRWIDGFRIVICAMFVAAVVALLLIPTVTIAATLSPVVLLIWILKRPRKQLPQTAGIPESNGPTARAPTPEAHQRPPPAAAIVAAKVEPPKMPSRRLEVVRVPIPAPSLNPATLGDPSKRLPQLPAHEFHARAIRAFTGLPPRRESYDDQVHREISTRLRGREDVLQFRSDTAPHLVAKSPRGALIIIVTQSTTNVDKALALEVPTRHVPKGLNQQWIVIGPEPLNRSEQLCLDRAAAQRQVRVAFHQFIPGMMGPDWSSIIEANL